MAFQAVFDAIYALLANDPALIPGLLGPRVPQNLRLYRASPQVENRLSTYEPNQPAEGWVIIEEPMPALRQASEQVSSNHEFLSVAFHVFGTTYAVTHAVLDLLDESFHWEIEQQRDVAWGDRLRHVRTKYEALSKRYSLLHGIRLRGVASMTRLRRTAWVGLLLVGLVFLGVVGEAVYAYDVAVHTIVYGEGGE
jgi:hypothetical protein